ncbi:hypothetical protein [Chiayiivirga flava]|uniref:Uncharacterized protein n=1 Tax=Chiayiivirga flava TaxID=659595 RepID=A0A7W8FYY5_9GAMM|nr:hypothetical protein [Chiayiivirga flava]MBB5207907.1 hypothetical protein [Chiayiivirga flava]
MTAALGYACAVWASGILPVMLWADARRAENLARGHWPNMDPGIAIAMAVLLLVPFAVVAVVVELVRMARGGAPLPPVGAICLGLLTGGPLAWSLVGAARPLPYWISAMVFGAGLVAFHACRHRIRARTLATRPTRDPAASAGHPDGEAPWQK